jgi:hypothetical protein
MGDGIANTFVLPSTRQPRSESANNRCCVTMRPDFRDGNEDDWLVIEELFG